MPGGSDISGTGAGGNDAPVPCALKAGSHSFQFLAHFFAIHDASPFADMRVKPRVAPGGAGGAAHPARANNFKLPSHEDASA